MKSNWIVKKKKLQLTWYAVDVTDQEPPLDIEEIIVSVREEPLVRWDIPLLVALGLDPLVYKAEHFHDGSGNLAVFEKWWYTYPYHITDKGLIEVIPGKEGFVGRGLAASPTPSYENRMY